MQINFLYYYLDCLFGNYGENCSKKCQYFYYGKKCDGNCLCEIEYCNYIKGCEIGKYIKFKIKKKL